LLKDLLRRHPARVVFVGALLAFLFLAPGSRAQTQPISSRLPADTLGYIEWSGKASLADMQKKNYVLQLYADPDLKPLWNAIAGKLNAAGTGATGGVATNMFLSLLENPLAAGVVLNQSGVAAMYTTGHPLPFGFFIVYDAAGKMELIRSLLTLREASDTVSCKAPPSAPYDFEGTPVRVSQSCGGGKFYTAEAQNYFLASDQKRIIERLIANVRPAAGTASQDKAATSLGEVPEYQAMRKYLGSEGSAEMFALVPKLDKFIPPGKASSPAVQVLERLHLEKIHAFGETISFAGEATRTRGAVLGDTSSPSLFDIMGANSTTFLTQPLASLGPSLCIYRLDLPATYRFIRAAVSVAPDSQQAATLAQFEMAAQSYLGMPIEDALGLFTGEVAYVTTYSDEGVLQPVFAATIQKPDDVLRVLGAVGGQMIVAEDSRGATTYLDLFYPYVDPQTRKQRKKFYYLAVTPQMILGAPRKAMLRSAVELAGEPSADAPAKGILASPDYASLRSLLPEKLSGFAAEDLARIPFEKILANLSDSIAQASKPSKAHPPDLSWLKLIKPEVISRHVHVVVSGWWKNPSGIYFDSYVQ